MEASISTAGRGKNNGVANLGTITLDVFDDQITPVSNSTGFGDVRLGQSPEIAEKELKGRNVTLQTKYANPGS